MRIIKKIAYTSPCHNGSCVTCTRGGGGGGRGGGAMLWFSRYVTSETLRRSHDNFIIKTNH